MTVAASSKAAPPDATAGGSASAAGAARFSCAAWLADILRDRILNGVYAPGQRIVETELQAEFGFSNGPTREALQRVVADGLAERAPWQGVRAISLTESEIVEVFQLRCALLEYAAALAARSGLPDVLAKAPALQAELAEIFRNCQDGVAYPVFTGRLSNWVLAAAGNTALIKAWEQCVVKARVYINASMRQAMYPNYSPHRAHWVNQLIEAIVARDETAARHAARKLTEQTLKDLGLVAVV